MTPSSTTALQESEPLLKVDADERITTFLFDTLGFQKAKRQGTQGHYTGHLPKTITKDNLRAHLRGDLTLGFPASRNGSALFIALDVDKHWKQVRPVLRVALEKHGLEKATFLTTGSDENRGKVIVTLARPVPQAGAHKFMKALWNEIVLRLNLRYEVGDVDVRPSRSGQSLLRIGGRNQNPTRGAVWPDRFLGLDGRPLNPESIVPAVLNLWGQREPSNAGTPYPQKFVWRWIRGGWERGLDRGQTMKRLCRLACESIRCYGRGATGEDTYFGWVEQIEKNHPALGVLRTKARSAWPWALSNYKALPRTLLITQDPSGPGSLMCNENNPAPSTPTRLVSNEKSPPKATERLIQAILSLAERRGLYNPNVLSFSQREISEVSGDSQRWVSSLVKSAVEQGRLVIHDEGTRGAKGFKAIFGLVLPGQTVDAVATYGASHRDVLLRKRLKAQYSQRRSEVPFQLPIAKGRFKTFRPSGSQFGL